MMLSIFPCAYRSFVYFLQRTTYISFLLILKLCYLFCCWILTILYIFCIMDFYQIWVLSCFSHVLPCDPMDCSQPGSSVHGISPGVGCHFLLQRIFPTHGSNLPLLHLLHWQVGSLPLLPPGKPPKWLANIVSHSEFSCNLSDSFLWCRRVLHFNEVDLSIFLFCGLCL